ncbi:MAG: FMN-binding negative transcriptional regulator [Pseudomonadota bacterium]
MYLPSHFEESRIDVLHALIAQHPLGALVTHGADGLGAEHIPFEVAPPTPEAPFGILRAHVARANPVWRRHGAPTLVLFQGPSAYVSPSLYEEKAISGKVVPTYNYALAHAHGTLRAVDDPAWLLDLLARLTGRHEAGQVAPWSVRDAPPEYIDKMLAALVGIEIVIDKLQGKWKLSQNRSPQDRRNIAAHGAPAMADLMRATLA